MIKTLTKIIKNAKRKKITNQLDESMKEYEEYKIKLSIQLERNLKGIELEKKGDIEKAIQLYEDNIKDDFEGNHPYDRLAIIYRKKKLYQEEKRVLEKAIEVFEKNVSDKRSDKNVKLDRFKERLRVVNDKHLKE